MTNWTPPDPRAELVDVWLHDCADSGPTATERGQECPWCGAREDRAQMARDAEMRQMLGRVG